MKAEKAAARRPKFGSSANNEDSAQSMVVCGVHPVEEALGCMNQAQTRSARLSIADSRKPKEIQAILNKAQELGLGVQRLESAKLDKLAQGVRHQGIVLELPPFVYADFDQLLAQALTAQNPLFLLLDQVQDPHNLGAIIRSAVAFGVSALLLPKDRSALITSTSLKTSAGLAYKLPIVKIGNLVRTMELLKQEGFRIYGADMQGTSHSGVPWQGPTALVMGSESTGLRRLSKEHCDELVRVAHEGIVDSLNVSVACAILLCDAYGKRA